MSFQTFGYSLSPFGLAITFLKRGDQNSVRDAAKSRNVWEGMPKFWYCILSCSLDNLTFLYTLERNFHWAAPPILLFLSCVDFCDRSILTGVKWLPSCGLSPENEEHLTSKHFSRLQKSLPRNIWWKPGLAGKLARLCSFSPAFSAATVPG